MYQRRGFDGTRELSEAEISRRGRELFNAIYQRFGGGRVAIVATAHRYKVVPEGEWNPSMCATELAAYGFTADRLIEASQRRQRERERECAELRQQSA